MNTQRALNRLHTMGDWLEMEDFAFDKMYKEIHEYDDKWQPYNRRKPNNRFGLSITSLDGGFSGIPDLDSLREWNIKHNTNINNSHINTYTDLYHNSPTLQKVIEPWKPWLGRCHFLKLNAGGYFPEHYDINKTDYEYDEIRLIGFVKNCDKHSLKFVYEDTVVNSIDGKLYYFNANKRHSVFSMRDDCIMLVMCLHFDEKLFEVLVDQYIVK